MLRTQSKSSHPDLAVAPVQNSRSLTRSLAIDWL
jgi:hypothetical protein